MGTVLKTTPAPNWTPIRASRMSDAATVALGTIGALTLGVLARLWMRLFSEHPEFAWSGTIGVLLGFTIFGLAQSGAALARRRRSSAAAWRCGGRTGPRQGGRSRRCSPSWMWPSSAGASWTTSGGPRAH